MIREELFKKLISPDDLISYLKNNYKYGWIDINGCLHKDTLKDAKVLYQVATIPETFECGYGTCIEQSRLEKIFFEKNNIEHKMFIGYVKEDINKILMHIFVMYKYNDKYYYIENAHPYISGIFEYESYQDGLKYLRKNMNKSGLTSFIEVIDIPEHTTYLNLKKLIELQK